MNPSVKRSSHFNNTPHTSWKKLSQEDTSGVYRTEMGHLVTYSNECERNLDTSLKDLTKHLLIGFKNKNKISEEYKNLSVGRTLHSIWQAEQDGVPYYLDTTVFVKTPCTFDVVMISKTQRNPKDVIDYHQFVDSFQFLENYGKAY